MECNPDDITEEFAQNWLSLPINRISMGAQTFSDERLRFLHRRHTADEVEAAVKRLRSVNIKNISVDLMFGFPNETLEEWKEDIERLLALDIEHISAYSLMYEEGTPLYRLLQAGKVKDMDDELYRQMYDTLIDRLAEAGYEQYEISNFVKPGFESRHNSGYWNETPYLGVGPSAHSYNLSTRSWNVSNVSQYVKSISKDILPLEEEQIDEITRYNDLITTALRTKEGIHLNTLQEDYAQYLLEQSSEFIKEGTMIKTSDNRLALTRKGYYISDAIMAELIKV